jgi:autotransporter-associated beta strand protein
VTTRIGNEGSQATFNMYGGSLNASNYLSIGRDALGILNQYGGTITKGASTSTTVVVGGGGSGTGSGSLNLYGGIFNASGAAIQVAFGTGSPVGMINLVGGQLLVNILSNDGGDGTVNLYTNATLTIGSNIQLTGGNGTFNFGGGTLRAAGSSTIFMDGLTSANVLVGGAVIDSSNNVITIGQSLLDGDGLGGGLTKLGTGTLYLNGANTYTGPTVVSAGLLGGNGSIVGSVIVNTNAGVAPGPSTVGTLTVGPLTLNGGSTNLYQFNSTTNTLILVDGGLTLGSTKFSLFEVGTTIPFSAVGTYSLIQYSGTDPVLDSTWTTASSTNPHITNPSYGFIYQFAASGGNLTLTISSTLNIGSWGVDSDGNWSVAGNWTGLAGTMPPRNPADSALFGTGSSLRTVTLDANETVGALTMNNTNSFVIKGGNILTLDRLGSGATINVSAGSSNSIQTALALNDNVAVSINSGQSLSLLGTITNVSSSKTVSVIGTGTLTLSGNNNYGPTAGLVGTTISGSGVLQVGNNSALGTGDVTNSASYTLQASAPGLSLTNNFTLGQTLLVGNGGNNNLTLAGVVSGSGSLTKVNTNVVTLKATNTYAGFTTVSAGTLNIAPGAALSPASSSSIFVGSLSNVLGVLTNSGTISVNASSGAFQVGSGSDLVGIFNMGGGSLTVNAAVRIGSEPVSNGGLNVGNGTFNMSGGTVTSLSYWQVGRNFGFGTMNMSGGNFYLGSAEYFVVANSGATGTFNMSGGNLYTTNQMLVAFANGVSGSTGTWDLSGNASVVLGGTKRFVVGIGGNGTLVQSGGNLAYNVAGVPAEIGAVSTYTATGLWNMSGGTATLVSPLYIGDGSSCFGTLNLSGTAVMSEPSIGFGANSGTGMLNLNGGTLIVGASITNLSTGGSGTFDFNGGTLRAAGSSTTFMTNLTAANVMVGGAIIDSSNNVITIGQNLLNGDGLGGGLTKLGSGSLTLGGANTYTGNSAVNNGTLLVNGVVAGPASVASGGTLGGNGTVSGVLTVQAGGSIAQTGGMSQLSLGSSPILGGSVVARLNRNGGAFMNDTINAGSSPLAYGGTLVLTNMGAALQVNDAFKLFNTSGGYNGAFSLTSQTPGQLVTWNSNNLTLNGTISVATVAPSLPTSPTNIMVSLSGSQMNLSWPTNYTGWSLQSNSVSLLSTGSWYTVAGSTSTNRVVLTIDPGKTNVFFRMSLP